MSIIIRERRHKDGTISLYLDCYFRGKRWYQTIAPWSFVPSDRATRKEATLDAKARVLVLNRQLASQALGTFDRNLLGLTLVAFIETRFKDYEDVRILKSIISKIKARGDEHCLLTEVTIDWCCEFFDDWHTGAVPVRANSLITYMNNLSSLLNKALKKGLIPANPMDGVRRPRKDETLITYLGVEDLKKLSVGRCPKRVVKLAYFFAVQTGLRKSEITHLSWANVALDDRVLTAWEIKTGNTRRLALTGDALEILELCPHSGDKLFDLPGDTTLASVLDAWADDSGVRHFRFHSARHAFGHYTYLASGDLLATQRAMGHTKSDTTAIYAEGFGTGSLGAPFPSFKLVNL